jgi:hypothetical protein
VSKNIPNFEQQLFKKVEAEAANFQVLPFCFHQNATASGASASASASTSLVVSLKVTFRQITSCFVHSPFCQLQPTLDLEETPALSSFYLGAK